MAAAVWRAGQLGALGFLLIAAGVATVVWGSWYANRPHELRGEALFNFLLGAHGLVCLLVLTRLFAAWRARESRACRAILLLPVLVAAGYSLLALSYFARLAWALVP